MGPSTQRFIYKTDDGSWACKRACNACTTTIIHSIICFEKYCYRAISNVRLNLQNSRQWLGTSRDAIDLVVDTLTVRTLDGISLLSPADRKDLMYCCTELLNGVSLEKLRQVGTEPGVSILQRTMSMCPVEVTQLDRAHAHCLRKTKTSANIATKVLQNR